jgi:hypothetical protein
MWGASILSLAALATLPCANAITLHKRDDPAVFALPIARSERSQALQKRSSKVASTALYNVVCKTPISVNLFQAVERRQRKKKKI